MPTIPANPIKHSLFPFRTALTMLFRPCIMLSRLNKYLGSNAGSYMVRTHAHTGMFTVYRCAEVVLVALQDTHEECQNSCHFLGISECLEVGPGHMFVLLKVRSTIKQNSRNLAFL